LNFAEFWQRYVATLPEGHPHTRARVDAFSFGDSPGLAAELAELVWQGRKRATASLAVEFTSQGAALPRAGDVSVVTQADGTPVAIIELTEVRELPFRDVDAGFAAEEGEGDGSLEFWRTAHREYFSRTCARLGGRFDDATPVICQKYKVLLRHA